MKMTKPKPTAKTEYDRPEPTREPEKKIVCYDRADPYPTLGRRQMFKERSPEEVA